MVLHHKFRIDNHIFETHYRIFGNIKSGRPRPLIALHGGPGIPSSYMEPFVNLHELYGIPVVLYDQIGCGESLLTDGEKRRELDELALKKGCWDVGLFMDESENLVEYLGIREGYDLLGHSWGGMLAAQYAATFRSRSKGLKHLILADSLARVGDWVEGSMYAFT